MLASLKQHPHHQTKFKTVDPEEVPLISKVAPLSTVRLEEFTIDPVPVRASVPAETVVDPVYVCTADKVNVEDPDFTKFAPVPPAAPPSSITPENVVEDV